MAAMGVRPPRRSRRRWATVAVLAALAGLGATTCVPVARARLRPAAFESLHLYDRRGVALGESLTEADTSATWTPLAQMSPDLAAAAVAAEDHRFFSHPGLDPLAIVRAALTNLRARHTVSGASTLTQQVARMILADEARDRGARPAGRTFWQKLAEAHLALRLEHAFTKRDLLEAWLNRVPVGGVGVGITAGAERYFGVAPSALSLEQAALLVGLPRGPSSLRPDRDPANAVRRRHRVLDAMRDAGLVSPVRAHAADLAPVLVHDPRTRPMRARLGAWAATELVGRGQPPSGAVRTTIDRPLEEQITEILRRHIAPLRARGVKSGAVVVLDHTTDELLALVGSVDEADPRWGQVHAAFALRQPGSALKPFVYLAALEQGRTLASLAADVEQAFPDLRGAYLPENYDHRFHGPVRYREALAQSLNVAAVDVLRGAGVHAAARVLERAGISTISRTPEHYGLGMTLGSLDVQLLELTEAYAVLARGGERRPTRILQGEATTDPGEQAFDPRAAYLIGDALSDPSARAPQFGSSSVLRTPYWTAVKTGTSKGFRDNFCLGYSRRYTVGVWVGDPAGKPMEHVSGVSGAGPVWRAVMDLLHATEPSPRPPEPAGLVHAAICPLSGALAGPRCPGSMDEAFVAGTQPTGLCRMHREVRLALADGLPLSPGCDAPAAPPSLETLYPGLFDAWASTHGQGLPDAWSRACPAPAVVPQDPPRLLAPARLEIVKLDRQVPRDRQQLLLLADSGDWLGDVQFLVDGHPAGTPVGPRAALWTVEPGEHRVTARLGPSGPPSEPHLVVVR